MEISVAEAEKRTGKNAVNMLETYTVYLIETRWSSPWWWDPIKITWLPVQCFTDRLCYQIFLPVKVGLYSGFQTHWSTIATSSVHSGVFYNQVLRLKFLSFFGVQFRVGCPTSTHNVEAGFNYVTQVRGVSCSFRGFWIRFLVDLCHDLQALPQNCFQTLVLACRYMYGARLV